MDKDVIKTNEDDIIDKDKKEEDTEDSDTYSRNKKMHCSTKKWPKNLSNMHEQNDKRELKDNSKTMNCEVVGFLEKTHDMLPKKLGRGG